MLSIKVADHQFHYVQSGAFGRPILMLHSTGIGAWQWRRYSHLLSPRKTLAIDLLGYAPSDSWQGSGAPDCQLDFLAAEQLLLEQSGPIDVIGHSYGGFIALRLAKKYPERVTSLLLHEPVAWGVLYDGEEPELELSFTQLCRQFFGEGPNINENKWLQHFVDYWNSPGTWLALPEKTKTLWIARFSKIYAEVSYLCLDRTPLSHWQPLQQPICITCSYNSPAHEKVVCQRLASSLTNATLFSHAGDHLSPLSHFDNLSAQIQKWFQPVAS